MRLLEILKCFDVPKRIKWRRCLTAMLRSSLVLFVKLGKKMSAECIYVILFVIYIIIIGLVVFFLTNLFLLTFWHLVCLSDFILSHVWTGHRIKYARLEDVSLRVVTLTLSYWEADKKTKWRQM